MIGGILADDLTGALDGGLQLAKRGVPVTVILSTSTGTEVTDAVGVDGVVVFDT